MADIDQGPARGVRSAGSGPRRAAAPMSPPGPSGLPVLGVAPLLARDLFGYLPRMARTYGDVVRLPLPGAQLILLSHPDHVNHVMVRHAARYGKGEMNAVLADGEHPGLPLADGAGWKRMRRLLSPKFSQQSLNELSQLMIDAISEHVDGWERYARTGERFELEYDLSVLTMSVLTRSGMSRTLDPQTMDRMVTHIRTFARYAAVRMITYSLPSWLPRPYAHRGRVAHDWLSSYFDEIIDGRIANPVEGTDLLNLLLEARFDDGAPLTRDELRGEMAGLIFGGFETTAAALAWTFALLAAHPEAAERAYAEADALGDEPVTAGDMPRLGYLRACFDEAMRIQGGPMYTRSPFEDDEIGGYRIPKGSLVAVSPTVLHHDPRFWDRPEKFNPDRFLTGEHDKNAFIPFNVGQRKCMGLRMAYMEALFTLATVLRRYRVHTPAGFRIRPTFHISTGIKGGVPVTLTRR